MRIAPKGSKKKKRRLKTRLPKGARTVGLYL